VPLLDICVPDPILAVFDICSIICSACSDDMRAQLDCSAEEAELAEAERQKVDSHLPVRILYHDIIVYAFESIRRELQLP